MRAFLEKRPRRGSDGYGRHELKRRPRRQPRRDRGPDHPRLPRSRPRERRGLLRRRRSARCTCAWPTARSASARRLRAESYLNIPALDRGGARERGRRGASRLRLPLGARRVCAGACEAAGLMFIGPPADAIERMGSKIAARELMERAGVPVVPGVTPADQSDDGHRRGRARIGYPVLVKASAGGGGKGMRIVRHRRRGSRGDRRGAPRGRGRVRRRHAVRRAAHRAAAARRDPGVRRRARQRRPPVRARVLAAAPPPEDRRGKPVAGADARASRARWARRRSRRRGPPAIATPARSSSCSRATATRRASISSR